MPKKSGKAREEKEAVEEIQVLETMEIPDLGVLRAEVRDLVREISQGVDKNLEDMRSAWDQARRELRAGLEALERERRAFLDRGADSGGQDAEFSIGPGPDPGRTLGGDDYGDPCLAAQREAQEAMAAAQGSVSGAGGEAWDADAAQAMERSLAVGRDVVVGLSALEGGGGPEEEYGLGSMEQAEAGMRDLDGGPPPGDS